MFSRSAKSDSTRIEESKEVAQSGSKEVANAVRRECECCGRRWLIPFLLLLIPVGAAVYFWTKKNDLERRLNNLDEPKKRPKKPRHYQEQPRYARMFRGETDSDETCEEVFGNVRFSDDPVAETHDDDQQYINHTPGSRSRSPSATRQKKQQASPKSAKPRPDKDRKKSESSGKEEKITERAIACLSRSMKYTNLKVIELQESICCLDQQVKDMCCEIEVLKEAFRLRATNAGMM